MSRKKYFTDSEVKVRQMFRMRKPRTKNWPDRIILSIERVGDSGQLVATVRNFNGDSVTKKPGPTTSYLYLSDLVDLGKYVYVGMLSQRLFDELMPSRRKR